MVNPTRVSLNCGEKRVVVRGAIACLATVTDTGPATSRAVPGGDVLFTTDGRGTFSPAACTLEAAGAFSARCQAKYVPAGIGDGTHVITASYLGSTLHAQSRTTVCSEVPLRCGGYALFTPGPDGGVTYSLVVSLGNSTNSPVPYRLVIARAGPDDTAPGVPLANGTTARGSAAPAAGDAADLYRFDVGERSDVTLTLRGASGAHVTLAVLTDGGRRVACACRKGPNARQRLILDAGTYYALVQAHGFRPGRYALSLLIRRITTLRLDVASANGTAARGSPLAVTATVVPGASGGVVRIQLDRLDPVAGWQFARLYVVPLSGNVARLDWVPPTVGRFRFHATFSGTREESPSGSGYQFVRVTSSG